MILDTSRATFLLGAGASVGAGLPTSVELTRKMAELVDETGFDKETSRAIHAAIGAMIAHDTALGESAFSGINIERLFSAVEMLADRENQELAPFVSTWSPATSFVGGEAQFPSTWERSMVAAISDVAQRKTASGGRRLKEAFAAGVKSAQRYEHGAEVFARLRDFMIEHLHDLLSISVDQIDYLTPLLQVERPLRIATLNYDTSIEDLAWRSGTSLSTGIGDWEPGKPWAWDDSEIHLLKLHGSLTWAWEAVQDQPLPELAIRQIERQSDGSWSFPNRWSHGPGLIFGQRGKVRADGPFIPMLRAFDEFLSESDVLVVIGYSFRDDHINTAISNWYNRTSGRFVLVDPNLPENGVRWTADFQQQLIDELHEQFLEQTGPDTQRSAWRLKTGHMVLRKGADEALAELLPPASTQELPT